MVMANQEQPDPYRVFFSHGGADGFIVKHVEPKLVETGATVFVDRGQIKYGDDFRETIFEELKVCQELLLLITPTSVSRPWIFAELGVAISRGARVVAVLYGVPEHELQSKGVLSLLGTSHYVELNDIEEYYIELAERVNGGQDE